MKELPLIQKTAIKSIDLVKYSGASGDFNEIHTVSRIAKEKGLTDIVAHGMLLMGWAGEAISEWFPNEKLKIFKVRFQAGTYPGTDLAITGKAEEGIGEVIIKDLQGEIKLKGYFEVQGE